MYIKNKYKQLFQNLDSELKLPAKFYKYLSSIYGEQKLIIKSKDICKCPKCNALFNSKVKIGNIAKCPKCKHSYIVKSSKIKSFQFKDQFAVLDRYKDYYIIRAFEATTWYSNGSYKNHVCEYGRQIFNDCFNEIIETYNDNVCSTIGGQYIVHKAFMNDNWRISGSYYHSLGNTYRLYYYNLKKLFKNTKWQYSQIWNFAKHYSYFCVSDLLKNICPSFELLVKLKLYNLALDSTDKYDFKNIKNNYQIIKQHLSFIKRNDLNFDELQVLKLTGKENIKIIKKLKGIDFDYFYKYKIDLLRVSKLTDINFKNSYEYRDYLDVATKLKYDLTDKRIKYPANIADAHNKMVDLFEIKKSQKVNKLIKSRYQKIKKYIFKNKKYIVFPTSNINEMFEESEQQNNCVKTYAEKVANGECDIYFMRLVENISNSLVTVEVRNNRVVQKRTKNNETTTSDQDRFLKIWEKEVLNENI